MCTVENAKVVLAAAQMGRPDLQAVCAAIAFTAPKSSKASAAMAGPSAEPGTLALVCGPAALSEQVSDICFSHGWSFHSEAFEL